MSKHTVHVHLSGSALVEVDIDTGEVKFVKSSQPTLSSVLLYDKQTETLSADDSALACGMAGAALAQSMHDTIHDETVKAANALSASPSPSASDTGGMKN